MKGTPIIWVSFIIAAFFILLPFAFALPCSDDFCYALMSHRHGFFLSAEYNHTNGRWMSALVLHLNQFIVNNPWGYRLSSLLILLTFGFSFTRFYHNVNKSAKTFFTFSILIFSLALLPNQSQILYWFTGSVNYLLPLAISLLAYSYFQKFSLNSKFSNLVIALIFLFLAASFNEISLFSQIFILLFLFEKSPQKKIILKSAFLALFAAFLLFILSPGNYQRQAQFSVPYYNAEWWLWILLQSFRFILWALLPFLFLIWIFRLKITASRSFVWLLSPILIAVLLPYFATGQLGQHRTPAFAILLVFSVFFSKYPPNIILPRWKSILFGFILLLLPGVIKPLRDLCKQRFVPFTQAMQECYVQKLQNPWKKGVPTADIPTSLENIYPFNDSARFKNACFEVYLEETKVKK